MRRRTVATIAVGAMASVVVGGVALAQVTPRTGPMFGGGGSMGGGMMGMMATGDTDQWFIHEMIPHHEDAVVMAEFAPAQAEHQELAVLAQQIRTMQTHEIAQMRAWYREWHGTADVPAGRMDQMHESMAPMMGGMHDDPASLDGAKPFDKAFIEQMVPHHQMAVMMSSMALRGASHPELRQLLQSIITSQSAEIAQMRAWYAEWYG
jgi:uncharacterized protein (DUF305 family)